jgi:uncharacterized protein YndB with AHSA1/START domain
MNVSGSDFRIFAEGTDRVVTLRTFHAPVAKVMRAHLEPDLIRLWMPGPGMILEICEIDARVGGALRLGWRMPDGAMMWVTGRYTEISATRIAHTERFDPDWTGGETLEITEFIAQGDKTLLRNEIIYHSTAARDAAMQTGQGEGTAECYLRLDAMLAKG